MLATTIPDEIVDRHPTGRRLVFTPPYDAMDRIAPIEGMSIPEPGGNCFAWFRFALDDVDLERLRTDPHLWVGVLHMPTGINPFCPTLDPP